MPDDIKIYLLHKLFGFSTSELGKMLDRQLTSVSRTIRRVADKMMAGELIY